jgi:hypothetical protein
MTSRHVDFTLQRNITVKKGTSLKKVITEIFLLESNLTIVDLIVQERVKKGKEYSCIFYMFEQYDAAGSFIYTKKSNSQDTTYDFTLVTYAYW